MRTATYSPSARTAATILGALSFYKVAVEHTVKDAKSDSFLAVTTIEGDLLPDPLLARPEHYLAEYLLMESRKKMADAFGELLR